MAKTTDDFEEGAPKIKPKTSFDMGGGTMKVVFTSFVVTLVILAFMSFAGGVAFVTKKDFTANLSNVTTALDQAKADLTRDKSDVAVAIQNLPSTISNQVNSIVAQSIVQWNSQLSSLSDRVTELNNTLQSNIATFAQYATKIDEANSKIASLESRVAALEAIVTPPDDGTGVIETETRWTFSDPRITYSSVAVPADVSIYVESIDPRRIEDEDLYEVVLGIQNGQTAWVMGYMDLELVLTPKDYVPINDTDTYLDSDDYPWLTWNADFALKTRENQEVCRRITFTSDRYLFNRTLAIGEKINLDLVLELYYK